MTKLTIYRTLTNAANRKQDQMFGRTVIWPAVPRAGDKVDCGVIGKADVDEVVYGMDGEVSVHLHADHRTFKATPKGQAMNTATVQKRFAELWRVYENWDWTPAK